MMTLDLPSLRALAHLVGWHRGCGLACGRPVRAEWCW